MTTTLVLPDNVACTIESAAIEPLETAGVILATYVETGGGDVRLLGRAIHMVAEADYSERHTDRLAIRSTGYVDALAEAERLQAIPLWFHTHPSIYGIPRPSLADTKVDNDIADLFRLRSGSPFYGTLIVSPREGGLAFSGSLQTEMGSKMQIERLWLVGERWRLYRSIDMQGPVLSPIFDRNVRAFGSAVQETLGSLAVTVVGCGGTGSALSEQLLRLGVRDLCLIDADTLSASNVTRVFGSTLADIGKPKADILRDHLSRIVPDLKCEAVRGMITKEEVARRLIGRDLVFGCTDDNAGRLVLSRLASYMLTPVVDVGVLLSSDEAEILRGIDGRVTILTPGSACLVCRDRVDLARASVELRAPDERKRLEEEGYAPALGQIEPAVVAFTTAVAAAAVNELLERLVGYGPTPRPTEILLRIHDREISTNRADPKTGHYCHPDTGKIGLGPATPFLEQVWLS